MGRVGGCFKADIHLRAGRRVYSDRNAPFSFAVVFVFIVSTGNAFAAGYAYAKAVFEFERASWGVKRRASRVGEADFTS